MKTAERENPNRRPQCVANRADGAASQYRSCSIMWAAKQENFQPAEKCFFLTSPFIELPAGLVLFFLDFWFYNTGRLLPCHDFKPDAMHSPHCGTRRQANLAEGSAVLYRQASTR